MRCKNEFFEASFFLRTIFVPSFVTKDVGTTLKDVNSGLSTYF